MKISESPTVAIPGPRAPGTPRGPRGPRPGRQVARRRIRRANLALAVVAAIGLAVSLVSYLADHPAGLFLGGGLGGLTWILGTGGLLVYTLGNMGIRPYLGTGWRVWASSVLFALVCLGGTATVWVLEFHDKGLAAVPGVRVDDEAQVNGYIDQALGPRAAIVPRIPTGVFVQSLKFAGANDVAVTGVLWQRYAEDVPAELRKGVVLPEAGDAWSAKEVYRTERGGVETVGWSFDATLRERFDYRHYPLDAQSAWLRMRPADITQDAVIVPDFGSYPEWRTDGRYGLDPGFVNEGWRTQYTAFSYVPNDYTSSFGTGQYGDERSTPELYFNVGMSRDFVKPLISRLIPVLFIVVLIFASLFAVTLNADRRGLTGFSVSGVIGFAVSMLLVITVQHTSVLEATGNQSGLVYLEWCYITMYLVIVLVALNALAMSTPMAEGVLGWRGNLLPKLLYWPVVLGVMLMATLVLFTAD